MEWLVWIGAALTLLGLVGLVWSILLVLRARRAGLDDATLRARVQAAMPINLGALLLSFLGLGLVLAGVLIG